MSAPPYEANCALAFCSRVLALAATGRHLTTMPAVMSSLFTDGHLIIRRSGDLVNQVRRPNESAYGMWKNKTESKQLSE
jgi:hypothetical protein